jgi:HAD superfamily phosphatase (TIGR01681 family)
MPKQYSFKLAVFDLDQTLWDGRQLYDDVKNVLNNLKESGVIMHVASFHLEARKCCEYLNIQNYFSSIQYGRTRTKAQMINDILIQTPYIQRDDVVFFDDNFENIINVRMQLNIKTVHINNGLSSRDVPCLTETLWYSLPKTLPAWILSQCNGIDMEEIEKSKDITTN